MTTFSVGFGHVRGRGPFAGGVLPSPIIRATEEAIQALAESLGGSRVCVTRGQGVDEHGSPEPCSVIVVKAPESRQQEFVAGLSWLAEAASQRCFGVVAGESFFPGPVAVAS